MEARQGRGMREEEVAMGTWKGCCGGRERGQEGGALRGWMPPPGEPEGAKGLRAGGCQGRLREWDGGSQEWRRRRRRRVMEGAARDLMEEAARQGEKKEAARGRQKARWTRVFQTNATLSFRGRAARTGKEPPKPASACFAYLCLSLLCP